MRRPARSSRQAFSSPPADRPTLFEDPAGIGALIRAGRTRVWSADAHRADHGDGFDGEHQPGTSSACAHLRHALR